MTTQPTLRLTQSSLGADEHAIAVEWLGDGAPLRASANMKLALTDQDQQDLRWYLEEYPKYPFAPNPERAARVEARMRELGTELFTSLFECQPQTRRLWGRVADRLDDLRVEVVTDAEGATALPWELLRDPVSDTVLALHARSFVRAAPESVRQALALDQQHVIRILLVICRPRGGDDVPFRSVASRLIKGLSDAAREVFRLDVLRPPTFAQLERVLEDAKARGEPYHVVHFDGHGVYDEVGALPAEIPDDSFRAAGPQGFLLFESGDRAQPQELVHGSRLGELLVRADVPLLVLNACRSAHAETSADDEADEADGQAAGENSYEKVRAFGSLAQQVMLAGVGGVVAMRYNVYVVTAAQFVAELYRALVRGASLGEAVTRGRKNLNANRVREVVKRLELQDWLVPVVYEAQATRVFTPPARQDSLDITISAAGGTPARGTVDQAVPAEPDVGFFGRDETLLALDRAFDTQHVALLHAYAGSGKTTTAAEFARWYALTGGVDGPVLWSSFEQHRPLAQALDQLGRLFDPSLQRGGIQWDAIADVGQKRDLALQIMRQVPVLWVWDNVEPVAGFPEGTPSAWSAEEQRALADFLRAARGTKAKFLLTSRRDERGWLGELPARIAVPPMPMSERRQLAEALAAKYGVPFEHESWRPLLRYSEGNPLTLTVVVGQALRDGLRSAAQVATYVEKLRAGAAAFDDEPAEGRSRSLGASLSYGFQGFSERERAVLALLYHFQGFVDVDALRAMGNPKYEWHLPEIAGLTREEGIALLDRAAEIGLLMGFGGGYYRIHPALPWFFRRTYEECYPPAPGAAETGAPTHSAVPPGLRATRAFVEAIGELGGYYHGQYNQGNPQVIGVLRAEEANLLYAWRLARQHGWYSPVTSAMQGLRSLYEHTGRRAEWRQLVVEVVRLFVDPATDGPLSGREKDWSLVTGYRVQLLREERQWAAATRLQGVRTDYWRQQAAPLLTLPPEQLDGAQRNTLRSLAASLHELGEIQREQGGAACVDSYTEASAVLERIGAQIEAATCAFSLGHAYKDLPVLRDLAQAEHWYRRALDRWAQSDSVNRGKTLGQLGAVSYERFREARQAGQPGEATEHLNTALKLYQEALETLPPDEVDARAVFHNQLGNIYSEVLPAYLDQCVAHYRESIRYKEQAGNVYAAALTRENVAIAYWRAGRLDDALLFARAALRNFEEFGAAAADRVQRARQLIAAIEAAKAGRG